MPGGEESFNLNLGDMEIGTLDSFEAAEKFLASDPSELEVIDNEEGEPKKKEEKKKQPEKQEPKKKEEETPEQKAAREKLEKIKNDPLAEVKEEEEEDEEKKKEEEETDDEKKNEEEEDEEQKKNEDLNQFEAFSKDLIRIGAFNDLADGEKLPSNPDEFLTKWNLERQRGAAQWLDDFLTRNGESNRDLFEAIFINGVEPKDYLSAYSELQSFENVDMEHEDNQKAVFREFYRRLGWEEADIEKKLQKTVDYGDLEVDTKKFHEQIVKQDKQRLENIKEEAIAQQENQKRLDDQYKTSLQTSLTEALKKKEINGIPISDQTARKAFDFLSTKKYKLPDGQLLTEFDKFILESKRPENIQKRLLIALLQMDNFNFSNIKKKALTEETNSIFETVQRKTVKKNRDVTKTAQTSKSAGWFSL